MFVKPNRPDGQTDNMGLTVLDEPILNQTDPLVLEMQLRQNIKSKAAPTIQVRSIEDAHKNGRSIQRWITSINDLHKNKPPAQVQYSKQMPDPETIMQVWPTEMEEALRNVDWPDPNIELDLATYARVLLSILDIPV